MKRKCSRCKLLLELNPNNFYKDCESKDGYRSECKACTKIDQSKYYDRPTVRFAVYKRDAIKRGLEWSLTLDEFQVLRQEPCKYCGNNTKLSGIDRVNNKIGYTKDNSVPCCEWCNRMKWKFSEEDFLKRCQTIADKCC